MVSKILVYLLLSGVLTSRRQVKSLTYPLLTDKLTALSLAPLVMQSVIQMESGDVVPSMGIAE